MTTQQAILDALAKKQQRAARFGLPPPSTNDPVQAILGGKREAESEDA